MYPCFLSLCLFITFVLGHFPMLMFAFAPTSILEMHTNQNNRVDKYKTDFYHI